MARELRDRYLEEVNAGRLLPGDGCHAKYDVARRLPAAEFRNTGGTPAPLSPVPLLLPRNAAA